MEISYITCGVLTKETVHPQMIVYLVLLERNKSPWKETLSNEDLDSAQAHLTYKCVVSCQDKLMLSNK